MNNTNEILTGIDFGTTNTVVSYFLSNKYNILSDGVFKIIPSKIGKMNGKIYCGNYIPINCKNIVHSFKNINEIKFDDDIIYSQLDLFILFFSHIKDLINKYIKTNIIKSVITVPSNFNDKQRELIRYAFEKVDIQIIRIINEPSAAALAYGLTYSTMSNEKILVIDTGGGTMDFTILNKTELFFEVIHSQGLNDLGGNNFTEIIYNNIINTKKIENINKTTLWYQSQKIKEKLSYLDYYTCSQNEYSLSRNKFNNLINDLILKIETTLEHLTIHDINYVILVGGSSRIPILQETIEKKLNKKPWIHPNLEFVVAEGACIFATIIENKFISNNDIMLLDVVPLSLGVELADGTYSIIIPKNTPLPVKRSQKYTTNTPSDKSININIYQGERKIANKNSLIGNFIFDKITLSGCPIIEITFKIDSNSIINISIIDKKSGLEKNICIKDIPNININDIIIQSAKINECDENELIISQNRFLIKTHIENALINLDINDKIEDKDMIINDLNKIDENIENMNNFQLIETLKYLNDKYLIIGTICYDNNDFYDKSVEKICYDDRKNELKKKIELLLIKHSEWNEYLLPVLEELTYNTTSIEYINEKLSLINDLENSNNINHDYKQEINNLCLYLKSEIETGNINLKHNTNILTELIDNTLLIIEYNNVNTDWKELLDVLNKKCEIIYNIK